LISATREKHEGIVRLLLAHGADLHLLNTVSFPSQHFLIPVAQSGESALTVSVQFGYCDLTRILLFHANHTEPSFSQVSLSHTHTFPSSSCPPVPSHPPPLTSPQRCGSSLLHLLCASSSSTLPDQELQERYRLLHHLLTDCGMTLNPIPGQTPPLSTLPSSLRPLSSISPLFSCYSHRAHLMAHHIIQSYRADLNCVNEVLHPLLPLSLSRSFPP
jgi:hypothetical protein